MRSSSFVAVARARLVFDGFSSRAVFFGRYGPEGQLCSSWGFTGDDAPRAVQPFLVVRPKMLGIMAGMDQKDSCLEEYRKNWVLLGDGFTTFPYAAQCLDFSVACYASAYSALAISTALGIW